MLDHTLKAAAGAAFFTVVFFLLIAFQPDPPRDVFSPDEASATSLRQGNWTSHNLADQADLPSQEIVLEEKR